MRRNQKILVTSLWAAAVLAMLSVVGTGLWAHRQGALGTGGAAALAGSTDSGSAAADQLPVYFDAPSFSLTDQDGRNITNKTLQGDVWVGMLFFSNCPGICPMMTAQMTELQKTVTSPDIRIVSFSVDPERDTPEVMKAYADRVGADQSRWYFLTGPKPTMFEIAHELKLSATPAHDGQPISHTSKALLFDRRGHVRGIYDATDSDSIKQLAKDAKRLLAEPKGKTS